MNRTTTAPAEAPSQLMGTLAIMGFAAEDNLRNVAKALGHRDLRLLSNVAERNAKQARLRAEIEEQIVEEMSQPTIGTRARCKLVLATKVASMFERMGAQTVEIAELCSQILRQSRPSRTSDLKKLIEHAVYITDRAATGLVEEDLAMAQIAQEQKRAANELNTHINRDLAVLAETPGDAAARADLLSRIACMAHGIVEEAGQLAVDVIVFLNKSDL